MFQFHLNNKYVKVTGGVFGGLIMSLPALPVLAQTMTSALNPCPGIYYEEPFNSTRLSPQGCPPNAAVQRLSAQGNLSLAQPRNDVVAGQRSPGYPGAPNPNQILLNQQPSDTIAGERSPGLPGAPLTPNRIVAEDAPTTPGTVLNPNTSIAPATGGVGDPDYSPSLRDQTNPPVTPPLPENRADAVANIALAGNAFDTRLINNTNAVVSYEIIGQTGRRYLQAGQQVTLQNLPVPATIAFTRQDDGFVEVIPVASSEPGLLAVQLDEDRNPLDQNQGVLRVQQDGQVFLN